jgi:competence protein ComEC
MQRRVFQARLFVVVLLVLYAGAVWVVPELELAKAQSEAVLYVHFLDVGQGDAILIETPEGDQVLIDGGPNASVLQHLAQHLPFTDRTIEVVLGTHPDLDHVGGLSDVLAQYRVPTIITTEAEGASAESAAWIAAVAAEGAVVHDARAGQTYQLGASTTLTILSPSYDPTRLNSNAGSIVALLTYGSTAFMLTGDAPQGVEQYLADTHGSALAATVLKLGHHGSDTSTHPDFLEAVDPAFAVVSAGRSNRYNHPDPAVLARVASYTDAQIVSTQDGTVTFRSDGTTVELIK